MLVKRHKVLILIGFIALLLMIFDYMEVMSIRPVGNDMLLQKLENQFEAISLISYQLRSLTPNNDKVTVFNMEDFPDLTGPRTTSIDVSKSLVVVAVGKKDKELVNKTITTFFNNPDHFSIMLFHYDTSTYHEFDWFNKLNVISIRIVHKMKWWYIKRFLTPNIAADVDFPPEFNPYSYERVATAYKLGLSQPSHMAESSTSHLNLMTQEGTNMGRYTKFIECGPAVWLSSEAYQCIYNLLQVDLTSGWGLDVLWADYLQTTCKFGNESVAVLDAFQLIHAIPSSGGTASSNPGFNDAALYELVAFADRFKDKVQVNWGLDPEVGFGKRECRDSLEPSREDCNI